MNLNIKSAETSPQFYARVGGVLYLFIIVAGICSQLFRDKLTVSGDVTATINNIISSQLEWRVSLVIEQIWLACSVVLTLILYVLLKPVNKNLALLAVFFNLVCITVECVTSLSSFAVLFPLGSADYLKTFEPDQLNTLAYLSLKLYDYGFASSLLFFAGCLFLYGYLIYKSEYFPKTIGVLLVIASVSYVVNSFVMFLAPTFVNKISPVLVLAFVGELSLCLWLLVKGVNMSKWNLRQTTTLTGGN